MASLEGHHILLLYTITCKGTLGVSSKHILTLVKAYIHTPLLRFIKESCFFSTI